MQDHGHFPFYGYFFFFFSHILSGKFLARYCVSAYDNRKVLYIHGAILQCTQASRGKEYL